MPPLQDNRRELPHQTTNCATPSRNDQSMSWFSVMVISTFVGGMPGLAARFSTTLLSLESQRMFCLFPKLIKLNVCSLGHGAVLFF